MNNIIRYTVTKDFDLSGKFLPDQSVILICHATYGDISIRMPDARSTKQNIFYFYKKDSSTNKVILTPINNQNFMGYSTVELAEQNRINQIFSDSDNWVILNSY